MLRRSIVGAIAAASLIVVTPAGADILRPTQTTDSSDGICNAQCSLRDAVREANTLPGEDTIKLKAKTYELSIEGDGDEDAEEGDLDLLGDTVIVGADTKKTQIRGSWATEPDRLFQVLGGEGELTASKLTLRDGDGSGSADGGAVYVEDEADVELKDTRVLSNEAPFGAAIYSNGDMKIRKTLFRGNVADLCCGAVYSGDGTEAALQDVVFDDNYAAVDTGAYYADGDSDVLRRVTFSRNETGGIAGALVAAGSDVRLENSTFSGNTATGGAGGAVYVETAGVADLNNVTITGNTAFDAGGFHVANNTPLALEIRNSIVAFNNDSNTAPTDAPDCGGFAPVSRGYNLIGDTDGCSFIAQTGDQTGANPALDPKLLELASNGGPTKTHALKAGSPARNAGNPDEESEYACATRDQRGERRPQGGRCDIGAYERN